MRRWLVILLTAALILLFWLYLTTRPAAGDKEATPSETGKSFSSLWLNDGKDRIIYKPNVPTGYLPDGSLATQTAYLSHTPIRARTPGSHQALETVLREAGSPLADFVPQLLQSPYWSTILGICYIEEYGCTVNPYNSNNLWGLMSNGHLLRFDTLPDGINAIDKFIGKAENNGRTTVESFEEWYCQSECTNWFSTVKSKKAYYESLERR